MKRALVAALGLALAACRTAPQPLPEAMTPAPSPSGGVRHEVEKGQTLWRIARAYGVTLQELAEQNDITDVTQIRVGQTLFIPGAQRVLKVEPAQSLAKEPAPSTTSDRPASSAKTAPVKEEPPPTLEVKKGRFSWPVEGVLYSRFGQRNGTRHDGIDISAPKGTPITAADDGEVLYSGVQRGYGNIVLLKHVDGLITIYAHNDENLVAAGAKVRRGQVIAKVGRTGRATGYHLHFEVRKDRAPRNPLFFLP